MANPRSSRGTPPSAHPTRRQLDELEALLQQMLELPVNKVADEAEPPAPPPPAVSPRPAAARRAEPPLPPQEECPEAPPTLGMALRPVPAEEEVDEEPEPVRLPVQPPHRFRDRPPPPAEEAPAGPANRDDDWVPLRSSWKPSPHTWGPLAESWQQAQRSQGKPRIRQDESQAPECPAEDPEEPAALLMPRLVTPPPRPAPEKKEPARPEAPLQSSRAHTLVYPRPDFPSRSEAEPPTGPTLLPIGAATPEPGVAAGLPWMTLALIGLNRGFDVLVSRAGRPGRWLCGRAGRHVLGGLGMLGLVGALGLVIASWLGWTR